MRDTYNLKRADVKTGWDILRSEPVVGTYLLERAEVGTG